jgi:hypothetical protein
MAKKSKKGKEPKGLKAWRLGKKRAAKKRMSGPKKKRAAKKRMSGPKNKRAKKGTRGAANTAPNLTHNTYAVGNHKKKRKKRVGASVSQYGYPTMTTKKKFLKPRAVYKLINGKKKKKKGSQRISGLTFGGGSFTELHNHFVSKR